MKLFWSVTHAHLSMTTRAVTTRARYANVVTFFQRNAACWHKLSWLQLPRTFDKEKHNISPRLWGLLSTTPRWIGRLPTRSHPVFPMLHFLMLQHASLTYWLKVHLSALTVYVWETVWLYVSPSGACLLHDCSSSLVYCCSWRHKTQPPPTHLYLKQGRPLLPCLSFYIPSCLSSKTDWIDCNCYWKHHLP